MLATREDASAFAPLYAALAATTSNYEPTLVVIGQLGCAELVSSIGLDEAGCVQRVRLYELGANVDLTDCEGSFASDRHDERQCVAAIDEVPMASSTLITQMDSILKASLTPTHPRAHALSRPPPPPLLVSKTWTSPFSSPSPSRAPALIRMSIATTSLHSLFV